jgi:hypothetical protein
MNDQVKDDEMGKTYGTHGRENEYMEAFGGKFRRKQTTRNR